MLVSESALMRYMNGPNWTADQYRTATDVLRGVQGALEDELRRSVEPVLRRETLRVNDDGRIRFTDTPVLQILSMTDYSTGLAVPYTAGSAPIELPPMDEDDLDEVTVPGVTRFVDTSVAQPIYGNTFDLSVGFLVSSYFGFSDTQSVVVKYVGGYVGPMTEKIKLAIKRVAAREMTRRFDTSASVKGGTISQDTTPIVLGWTPEEFAEFRTLKRIVIV